MNARLAHIAADQVPVFREIRWGLVGSFALHLCIVLFAWFGLPTLLRPPPEVERPILVDLVPIADKTNPPPKAPDAPEPPKAEPVKPEPPKPEPPKPEPPKPEPPKPAPPKPEPPKPEPPKPQPKPEPKPEVTLPKPEAKPKPKPEPKPEPPPDDFASVLKSVDKFKKTQPPAPPVKEPAKQQAQPAQPVQRQQGSLANIASEPVTMSERDAIRAQIERNWNPPVGAKDAANLVIEIRILLNPDGSLRDARVVDTSRYSGDGFFRAAADSAVRAVHKSSPLKFPPQKYDQFQDFTLVFNPKEMFGR